MGAVGGRTGEAEGGAALPFGRTLYLGHNGGSLIAEVRSTRGQVMGGRGVLIFAPGLAASRPSTLTPPNYSCLSASPAAPPSGLPLFITPPRLLPGLA